ncbi:type IV pilin [Halovenus sp. WSH3]|uniref:Type IV pilin n=1 Tax=Halovenus carboxidivorans TaxID=2692199 RepID=A0A6B0TC04_9EURY|nr:CARDB domain-containing protein [Halovenus carboxidivorans]MXR52430.1 type IV pilin [Halovenus carboxidivorans]
MVSSERSQSETVGIVLLTAVVVVTATTAGLFVLSDTDDRREGDPLANVEVTPTASGIELAHQGGDEFNASRIRVVVERESGPDQRFVLAEAFDPVDGDGDQFAPGQRWVQSTGDSYQGRVDVTVVAVDRGQILARATAVVGSAGLELDVEETTISDAGSTNYTVTQLFEQAEPEDVTANATVTVGNESVLDVDAANATLVGNNTGSTTVTATYDGETSNTIEVDVVEDGSLEVVAFEHDNPVVPGDVLNITVTVRNSGATAASGTVSIQRKRGRAAGFSPSGLSEELRLDGGETTDVEFDYRVVRADAVVSLFRLRAVTADDRRGRGDDIEARLPTANVQVDALSLSDTPPYVVGEPLTAEVTLRNAGERAATGDPVNLTLGSKRTRATVSGLAPGQTDTVSLSVTPTAPGRDRRLTVRTPDDAQNQTVDVFEPASFEVAALTVVEDQVLTGENLTVRAVIENTGGLDGTQTVVLDTGSAISPVDGTETVTLSGGEQTTVTLTATGTAPGTAPISVETANDSAGTRVTVLDPPEFSLEEVPDRVTVLAGEPASIAFTVVNAGDVAQTQRIELTLGGQTVDRTTARLAGGERRSVTLNWTTGDDDVGTQALTVSTANESESVAVVVQDPIGDVTILSTNAPIEEGERLDVTATTGGVYGDALQLSVDGSPVNATTDTDDEVTLSWEAARGDAGRRTVTVTLYELIDLGFVQIPVFVGEDSTTVTVEPPVFSVGNLSAPDRAATGGSITVGTNVANEGLVTSEQSVELRIGSDLNGTAGESYTVLADRTVELAANTSERVAFANVTVPDDTDIGRREIGVYTEDDGVTAEIQVRPGSQPLVGTDQLGR